MFFDKSERKPKRAPQNQIVDLDVDKEGNAVTRPSSFNPNAAQMESTWMQFGVKMMPREVPRRSRVSVAPPGGTFGAGAAS